MPKPPIIILLLVASLFFSSASPVFAQSTAVPGAVDALTSKSTDNKGCQFKSAAGLLKDGKVFESAECLPQDLIAYMNALNTFFYRLAIVLAVLMITIGGMQWLMAIGNAGKIGKAKDTIQDAVVGLILALVAILLFNQIDSSFTELRPVALDLGGTACGKILDPVSCSAQASKGCNWKCTDATELAKPERPRGQVIDPDDLDNYRNPLCIPGVCELSASTDAVSAVDCNNQAALAAKYNAVYPFKDSAYTERIKTCVLGDGEVKKYLDTNQVFTYEQKNKNCNYTRGNPVCGSCAHSVNSCHYGRKQGQTVGAEAIDFNAIGGSAEAESALKDAIVKVLTTRSGCTGLHTNIKLEQVGSTWHTHVSTQGCLGGSSDVDLEPQ